MLGHVTPNAGSRTDSPKMTHCLADLFLGKSPRVALPWGSSIQYTCFYVGKLWQPHPKGSPSRRCSIRIGETSSIKQPTLALHHQDMLAGWSLQAESWRSGHGWQSDGESYLCRFWSGDIRSFLAFWRDSEDGVVGAIAFFAFCPRNVIQQLSSHYIGRVYDLFLQSVSPKGNGVCDAGSSWGLEDWVLSRQAACM